MHPSLKKSNSTIVDPRWTFEAIIEAYAISDPAVHLLGLTVRAAMCRGRSFGEAQFSTSKTIKCEP